MDLWQFLNVPGVAKNTAITSVQIVDIAKADLKAMRVWDCIYKREEKIIAKFKMTTRHKYCLVSEQDVVNIILRTAESWDGCGIISPSNITYLLKTSRYQINKHIKSLKSKGLLDYKSVDISTDEERYPPLNGYCLSKLGNETFKKELKELEELECELIQKCFSLKQ